MKNGCGHSEIQNIISTMLEIDTKTKDFFIILIF